jgi:hypothetical protein
LPGTGSAGSGVPACLLSNLFDTGANVFECRAASFKKFLYQFKNILYWPGGHVQEVSVSMLKMFCTDTKNCLYWYHCPGLVRLAGWPVGNFFLKQGFFVNFAREKM